MHLECLQGLSFHETFDFFMRHHDPQKMISFIRVLENE